MLAGRGQKEAIDLADTFCREAQLRVDEYFRNLYGPNDANMYKLAISVLKCEHAWLEQGIASGDTEMGALEELSVATMEENGSAAQDREILAGAH